MPSFTTTIQAAIPTLLLFSRALGQGCYGSGEKVAYTDDIGNNIADACNNYLRGWYYDVNRSGYLCYNVAGNDRINMQVWGDEPNAYANLSASDCIAQMTKTAQGCNERGGVTYFDNSVFLQYDPNSGPCPTDYSPPAPQNTVDPLYQRQAVPFAG